MMVPALPTVSIVDDTDKQLDREDVLPSGVFEVLSQYTHLFAEPTLLPPTRAADHKIPLVPGAQPFRLRPYRYNPAQKDEIEKQVQELLQNGLIRESNSPFASPVLLVKKKTGD